MIPDEFEYTPVIAVVFLILICTAYIFRSKWESYLLGVEIIVASLASIIDWIILLFRESHHLGPEGKQILMRVTLWLLPAMLVGLMAAVVHERSVLMQVGILPGHPKPALTLTTPLSLWSRLRIAVYLLFNIGLGLALFLAAIALKADWASKLPTSP